MAATTVEPVAPVDAEIEAYIEQDPDRPGRHHARFVDTGTHLWVVLGALNRTGYDVTSAARDWCLSEAAVKAAVRYYDRHRALFDAFFLLEDEEDRCRAAPCFG